MKEKIENQPMTHTERKILKNEQQSYEYLRHEALIALNDYRRCVNNFDFICDEKLVDVCIYDIQKSMSRYEYLVDRMKHINIP